MYWTIFCLVILGLGARIDGVHGPVRAYGSPCLYAIYDPFAYFRHFRILLLAQFAKHVSYLLTASEIISDSDPDPGILLGADELGDVCETIMPSGASVLAQTECAERDVEIVGYDDEALRLYLQLVHPVAHCLAAQIHVCGRLQKRELPAFE